MSARAARTLALAGLLLLEGGLLAGCTVSENVQDSARDVLTLRSGTVNELKALRGTGPFTRYEVAPAEMLEVAAAACRKARGLRGKPVTGVEVSPRYGEVTAKERAYDVHPDVGYSEDWRSAVVITVHPIEGEPRASRVEWHAGRRSPLLACAVAWDRVLPGLIAEALREAAPAPEGAASALLAPPR